jgi:hypothetical protein
VTTHNAQRVLNAVSLATPYEGWAVGDGGALVCLNAGVPEISPPDWIRTGANWVSVPHAPVNPDPRAIFEPGAVTSSFIRWDPVGKTLELFPEDFDEIEQGRSYWWFVWEGQLGAYRGIPSAAPFEISVPTAGWIWIGHPHAYPTAIADLSVRDEISGLVRTAWEDFTSPDPWLNWNILYWDTTARTVKIAGIDWGDDRMLRPWYGYRIWSMTEDLTLIVP